MIEMYAFLAMFTMQVVAMSVVYPAWFANHVKAQAANYPAERFAQLYPDTDVHHAQDRFLKQYQALNAGIAVIGLLLLAYFTHRMRNANWNDGPVESLVTAYFMAQMLPLFLIGWLIRQGNRLLKHSFSEPKRRAVLRRRGLFDFVSPSFVVLAGSGYLLFAAFVTFIQQDPFPGFAPYRSLGGMTLVYAVNGCVIYLMLYGRKSNPFETHTGRLHTISLTVKMSVCTCLACVVFVSLNFTLALLNLQRWEPFALSVFFVTITAICLAGLTKPHSSELHELPR